MKNIILMCLLNRYETEVKDPKVRRELDEIKSKTLVVKRLYRTLSVLSINGGPTIYVT